MIRACAALITAALAMPLPAIAGDTAALDIIGFTPDGAIFAFEEYGVQDGSGFPYANRFYVNTEDDSFVSGTPVRVRIDDEAATVAQARAKVRQQSQAFADDAVLAANRGHTAGLNPATETSADPFRMAVNPRPVFPPIDPAFEVRLEEIAVAQPADCQELGTAVGFRLLRIRAEADGVTTVLHEDQSIPSSRGCPLGYSLAGIQTFYPDNGGAPVFAVLIAVRRFGFEGPDHRHIAVAGRF